MLCIININGIDFSLSSKIFDMNGTCICEDIVIKKCI